MAEFQSTRRVFVKGALAAAAVGATVPIASVMAAPSLSGQGESGAGGGSAGFGSGAVLNRMNPLDEMLYDTAWASSLVTEGRLTL